MASVSVQLPLKHDAPFIQGLLKQGSSENQSRNVGIQKAVQNGKEHSVCVYLSSVQWHSTDGT